MTEFSASEQETLQDKLQALEKALPMTALDILEPVRIEIRKRLPESRLAEQIIRDRDVALKMIQTDQPDIVFCSLLALTFLHEVDSPEFNQIVMKIFRGPGEISLRALAATAIGNIFSGRADVAVIKDLCDHKQGCEDAVALATARINGVPPAAERFAFIRDSQQRLGLSREELHKGTLNLRRILKSLEQNVDDVPPARG
jgi:hypothetical protein